MRVREENSRHSGTELVCSDRCISGVCVISVMARWCAEMPALSAAANTPRPFRRERFTTALETGGGRGTGILCPCTRRWGMYQMVAGSAGSLVLCMHGSMTTAEPSPYSCKSRDKRIPIQLYGTLAGLVLSLLGIISHWHCTSACTHIDS